MNLLLINQDPEIQPEIDDFLFSEQDNCFFSHNTDESIQILNSNQIDLAVMIFSNIQDAAVLKFINDNYKDLEMLLMVTEEFDEVVSMYHGQYQLVRLPAKLNKLQKKAGVTGRGSPGEVKNGEGTG